MSDSLVEMKNISKNFGGLHALENVNVNLNAGEVVGILGHNGAGKSTLVKILSGAIKSDYGEIFINSGFIVTVIKLYSAYILLFIFILITSYSEKHYLFSFISCCLWV